MAHDGGSGGLGADGLDALEAFAHVIAHDLSAPLRGLSVHLRLLEREVPPDGGAAARIAMLQERLRQMDAMLRRVRSFSRLAEADGAPQDVDAADFVRECWERAGQEGQAIEILGDATWHGAPLMLAVVVEELLRNASLHGGADGPIRVHVDAAGVTVVDRGPGFPEPVDRLLDPFVRTSPDGAGSGLALLQHIARRSGGRLHLTSDGGARARFDWG